MTRRYTNLRLPLPLPSFISQQTHDGNEGKMLTFGNCFVKVLEERSESSTVVHDEHGAVCQAVSAVDGHF